MLRAIVDGPNCGAVMPPGDAGVDPDCWSPGASVAASDASNQCPSYNCGVTAAELASRAVGLCPAKIYASNIPVLYPLHSDRLPNRFLYAFS